MITDLTPEQESQIPIYAEKWRNIGLSTKPANREVTEDAIQQIYTSAGLPPPDKITWFESPMAMFKSNFSDETPRRKYPTPLFNMLTTEDRINKQIKSSVQNHIYSEIISATVEHIGELIREALSPANRLRMIIYLGHYRAAYLDYVLNVLKLSFSRHIITAHLRLWGHINYYLPFDDVCMVSERYSELKIDKQGLAHDEEDKAICYPDGWGIYCWHGEIVPEFVIRQSDEITPEKIISEKDPELAIKMLNRFGEPRFLRETGYKYYRSSIYNHMYPVYPEYYLIRLDNLAPDKILSEGNLDILRLLLKNNNHGEFIQDSGINISKDDQFDDVYHIEFANGDEPVTLFVVNHNRFERPYYIFLPAHVRTKNEQILWIILGDKIILHPSSRGDFFM